MIAVALGLMVFGVLQLDNARTDVLPEFRRPTVEVQTEALGLSAEEVEQLITVPLEQDLLNGVAFLDDDRVGLAARALVDRSWSSSRARTSSMPARSLRSA